MHRIANKHQDVREPIVVFLKVQRSPLQLRQTQKSWYRRRILSRATEKTALLWSAVKWKTGSRSGPDKEWRMAPPCHCSKDPLLVENQNVNSDDAEVEEDKAELEEEVEEEIEEEDGMVGGVVEIDCM